MEMSFESIMAVGTGMVSRENVEEQDNTTVNYDGYSDGLDMDITRTTEQLHFLDTYDKLQSLHSSEKLRMIKKINAAYNGKTIGNTNVANSVESFCNNAMSVEGIKEVAAKVKAKFIEIFKKIAEFFKNLITKVIAAKYKGKAAEEIKGLLSQIHTNLNELIKQISTTSREDEKLQNELVLKQQAYNEMRSILLDMLSCYSLAARIAKKTNVVDKKATMDDVVDTDKLNQVSPDLAKLKHDFVKDATLIKTVINIKTIKTVTPDATVDIDGEKILTAKVEELKSASERIKKAKEDMKAKVAKTKDKADKTIAPSSAATEEPEA